MSLRSAAAPADLGAAAPAVAQRGDEGFASGGHRSIQLLDPAHPTSITATDVYFSFASGRFAYDCISCGAKCCRGFGYQTTISEELNRQLRLRPGLALFMEPAEDDPLQVRVRNCPPACFFLSQDGRCGIHGEFGYGAKPETCRLFPFNQLRRVGRFLCVSPHSSLCPLQVLPGGHVSLASDHGALLDNMADKGIAARVPECLPTDLDPEQLVSLERDIIGVSEVFLESGDYLAFVREQLRLTVRWMRGNPAYAGTPHRDARGVGLDDTVTRACELFQVSMAEAFALDRDLVRVVVAMTPFIRSLMILRPVRERKGAPDARVGLERVPYVLAVLYVLASAVRRAGMQEITFQTLSRVYHKDRLLLWMLSDLDASVTWRKGADVIFPAFRRGEDKTAFLRLAKALLPSQQKRQPVPFGDLLASYAPPTLVERMHFLRLTAKSLIGRIGREGDGEAVSEASVANRFGVTLRRWCLKRLPESVLATALGGRRESHARGADSSDGSTVNS